MTEDDRQRRGEEGLGRDVEGLLASIGHLIPTPKPIDLERLRPPIAEVPEFDPALLIDNLPARIAANTEQTAEALEEMQGLYQESLRLTAENLKLSQQQREDAKAAEAFTRRMTWASLIVSVASFGAAIAAVVVSIALGVN